MKRINQIQSKLLMVFALAVGLMAMSFSGCNAGKDITNGAKDVKAPEAAPEWVGSRPHNAGYYIGVGTCSKTNQPLDYQTIAKKNALNDLASEISVRVQGETFLNSLEVNKNFSEEFISTISTTTDEKIENYEVAGIWENKNEYWVYYRLNKGEYQRQKQEKKNNVLSQAHDYYQKGLEAEKLGSVPAAFDLYMHGLFAMREYWDEVNEYRSDSTKVYLDNELYSSMQRIGSGLRIEPSATKISLSADNSYNANVTIAVKYDGKPVRGITVLSNYLRPRYARPKSGVSDQSGQITVNVSDVSTTEKSNNLDLSIDLNPLLAQDLDLTIQRGLLKTMRTDQRQVPIELITPSFYIKSDEKVFGSNSSANVLGSALNSELVKRGMRISSSPTETNYAVNITSNTTQGGSSQGFTVAFLEMTIYVKNCVTGEVVYQETQSSIKGLQLNLDAASMEAYKKGKEKMETEIVKSMMEAIL
ncbi:MAG: LPP20 family lipoprotein [Flavobacteriales bacterium]